MKSSGGMTRRDALVLLGTGAAAAALPAAALAQSSAPVFPMGAEINTAKRDGNIACIVEAGHPEMGRDVNFIRQVAMKSGMPIVIGGGFYAQPWYPKEISAMNEDQIVKALIKQCD